MIILCDPIHCHFQLGFLVSTLTPNSWFLVTIPGLGARSKLSWSRGAPPQLRSPTPAPGAAQSPVVRHPSHPDHHEVPQHPGDQAGEDAAFL